jgi:hypothetical protein
MGAQVISSVVEAAASYNLTDLPTVKTELGINPSDTKNDAYLTLKIAQVSQAISTYCNRVFVQETVQDIIYPDRDIEPFWSLGNFQPLQLSRFPVASVTSVIIQVDANPADNVTLVQGTDFILNGPLGQVIRLSSLSGFPRKWKSLPITVQFVSGYATVPGDLVLATLSMVTAYFQQKGINPLTKRTNQPGGLGEIEYWVPNNPAGAFPPSVTDLIDKYRVPVSA